MDEVIKMEERAYKIQQSLMDFCKNLKISAKTDIDIEMMVTVKCNSDSVGKIIKQCRNFKNVHLQLIHGDGYDSFIVKLNVANPE